jgi:hypothetical protein
MNNWIELIKAIIRPFIIIWGSVLYGICIIKAIEVPDLLAALVAAVILEYFGERALYRYKENGSTGSSKVES